MLLPKLLRRLVIAAFILLNAATFLHAQQPMLTVEAETMTVEDAYARQEGNEVIFLGEGAISAPAPLTKAGDYRIEVVARGQVGGSELPRMEVELNGTVIGSFNVPEAQAIYVIPSIRIDAGTHTFKLRFTNDFYDGVNDRNLLVDKTVFLLTPPPITDGVGTKVTIAWDMNQDSPHGYNIYRSLDPGILTNKIGTVGFSQLSYQDINLQPGTYYYAVTAYDDIGNESLQSNVVGARLTAPPPDPIPVPVTDKVGPSVY